MKGINMRFIRLVPVLVLLAMPALMVCASGKKKTGGSEVIVQRVDNNSLIRLRIYIDAKVAGTLKVGETSTYRIANGPHTIRATFEDYHARSTEVTLFDAYDSRIIFTVTDESIVVMGQEPLLPKPTGGEYNSYSLETAISNSFERATEDLKKKSKVAIINVDSDNMNEGDYALEELTYLAVHSSKRFSVIDRRTIDAFRSTNGIGVPSYSNDYILMLIGKLIGADYVISGRLHGTGELRRMRVKVLEVKTGRLIGDASERA
ncbi:MAG: hypothetical protein LBP37_01080 [Spirochaetaceae bacterium]|jgi:hypothetical protein|nr:hypothetical protein [Spirochaetaceae bacterium]